MKSFERQCLIAVGIVLCLTAVGCGSGGSVSGGAPPPAPALSLSPSSLSFTGTDAGNATAAQTVTLTNSGTAALTVSDITFAGTNASLFQLQSSSACFVTLAASATCKIAITFTPQTSGSFSASMSIADNASNSPQSVALSGTLAASIAPIASAQFAYVEDDDGSINMFTVASSGAWTPTSPSSIGSRDSAGAMVVDPLGKFVFTAGFLEGGLSSFSIAPSSGVLTYVTTSIGSDSNARPEGMAIDPQGRFIYVANTGIGTVSVYTIDRATGIPTPGSPATVTLGVPGSSQPCGIVVDPTGNYLYVAAEANPPTYMYSIDQTTGALTPLSPGTSPNAIGLCSLHFDPTGKFLYGAGNGGVQVSSIDPTTGEVTVYGPISAGNGSTDSAITPNGEYAYVANRTDNTISMYSASATTGNLTQLPQSPWLFEGGEPEPYLMSVDPSGQLLYVEAENVGIYVMSINADGTLSPMAIVSDGNVPVTLGIYPAAP